MGKKLDFDLKKVEKLAAQGLTQAQIADFFGVSPKAITEHKKYPEFSEALNHGKSTGISNVANTVYEAAMNGDLGAAMFFLRSRGSWVDRNIQANVTSTVSAVSLSPAKIKLLRDTLEDEY